MNTPICDFVARYCAANPLRLHMPGHKGVPLLGAEPLDITELPGADSLYSDTGIIRQSEQNASALFGAHTFYSAEGSSLAIRAMVHLALLHGEGRGRQRVILAGRNAHRVFLSAAALLDFDIRWIRADEASYLSCSVTPEALERELAKADFRPAAVYVTSPDYLGNLVNVGALAQVCHRYGCLLLVDNAHGAYLKFVSPSAHPMDQGADLCCDSAHKTLPVLTGGAYLHLSLHAPGELVAQAKNALALFGSTSPSFLILQSLDRANQRLASGYGEEIRRFSLSVEEVGRDVAWLGFRNRSKEPLKWALETKPYGYEGTEVARILEEHGMVCEFADRDFVVLMFSPSLGQESPRRVFDVLKTIPEGKELLQRPPRFQEHLPRLSVRKAMLSPAEVLPVEQCVGRILASPSVGCPPAVPILVCGEEITPSDVEAFRYYGIRSCSVVARSSEFKSHS